MAKIAAFAIGAVAIGVAILGGAGLNVSFMVGLAFAVAASANFPALLLALTWKRFNTAGAVTGVLFGVVSSIGLIILSPTVWPGPDGQGSPVSLENPGIISIPLGFLGCWLGTMLSRPEEQARALLRGARRSARRRAWAPRWRTNGHRPDTRPRVPRRREPAVPRRVALASGRHATKESGWPAPRRRASSESSRPCSTSSSSTRPRSSASRRCGTTRRSTRRPRPTGRAGGPGRPRSCSTGREPWDTVLDDSDPPFYKWFAGGKINASYNCLDRHVEAGLRRPGRLPLARGGGRGARHHLRRPAPRRAALRQRAEGPGDRPGRRRRDLPADDPRGRRGHAGLRAHRRAAQRRVRRLLAGVGARAHGVLRRQGADHRRRRAAQGQDGADQAAGRRGDGRPRDASRRSSWSSTPARTARCGTGATSGTTRRSRRPTPSARPSRWTPSTRCYILYTSGSTAKPKGILHTTGGYLTGVAYTHKYVFDLQARLGRVLVRGRRRLGHRAQLHRLRAPAATGPRA